MARKQKRNFKRSNKMGRVSVLMFLVLSVVLTISSGVLANPDFFGIQILAEPEQNDEAFYDVTRDKEGKVSYRYGSNLASPDIYCWGEVGPIYKEKEIEFIIVNNSKRPIEMNYVADKYELLTKDGTLYRLKILTSISSYPDIMNPQENVTIRVKNPLTSGRFAVNDIKLLGVTINYGKIFILLRRIEDEE